MYDSEKHRILSLSTSSEASRQRSESHRMFRARVRRSVILAFMAGEAPKDSVNDYIIAGNNLASERRVRRDNANHARLIYENVGREILGQ